MRRATFGAIIQIIIIHRVLSLSIAPIRYKRRLAASIRNHLKREGESKIFQSSETIRYDFLNRPARAAAAAVASFLLVVTVVALPPALAKGGGGGGDGSEGIIRTSPTETSSSSSYKSGYLDASRGMVRDDNVDGGAATSPTISVAVDDWTTVVAVGGLAAAFYYLTPLTPTHGDSEAYADGAFDSHMDMDASPTLPPPTSGLYSGSTIESDGSEQGISVDLHFAPDGSVEGRGNDSDDGPYTIQGKWTDKHIKWTESYMHGPNGSFTTTVRSSFRFSGNLDCRFVSSKGVRGQFSLGLFLGDGG
jgi:hypothetical protein